MGSSKIRQEFKKSVPGTYNDQAHIDEYLNSGKFPKIHDDIASVIRKIAPQHEPCIDLGSCTGLLAIQSIKIGRSLTIGIEGNKSDFNRAIPHSKVKYENFYIGSDTFGQLSAILKKYKPTLVIARRIIPEISMNNINVIKQLSLLFAENGVKHIILEGRKTTRNPKAILYNVRLEANCFMSEFEPIGTYKNCIALKNKRLITS
jgi:hypothetical protein